MFSEQRVNFLDATFEINLSVSSADIDESLHHPVLARDILLSSSFRLSCDLFFVSPINQSRASYAEMLSKNPDVGDGVDDALQTYLVRQLVYNELL